MTAITRIDVRLKTGNRSGAGTDGDIYLGIGGREFSLDSAVDDFQQNADRTYTFGAGSNVSFAAANNPSSPYELLTENLDRFPAYIRFAPKSRDDNWNIESVIATVNPGPGQLQYQALGGSNNLWLGVHSGLHCYLVR
ncbi:MAG: hypothetical protein LC794_06460 [Acidobacteria bacterium]|nr:hypothetical protein [Acidobacteriota bacterium]